MESQRFSWYEIRLFSQKMTKCPCLILIHFPKVVITDNFPFYYTHQLLSTETSISLSKRIQPKFYPKSMHGKLFLYLYCDSRKENYSCLSLYIYINLTTLVFSNHNITNLNDGNGVFEICIL